MVDKKGAEGRHASAQAEAELKRRSWELTERVKELRCLYGISRLRERPGINLNEFLQEMIHLIPPAWQHPDLAEAWIKVGDVEYSTPGFTPEAIAQSSDIKAGGQIIGALRVCYRKLQPGMEADPFLDEERHLLDSLAERVGRVVGQYRAADRITEYQAQLRSLASELALTGERERRRIAQDLHDQIGHKLASIKFKLRSLKQHAHRRELDEALALLEQTIDASRNLTFELSPPVLQELGLGAALEWLLHQLHSNYGIPGTFIDDHQPKPLSEDLRLELFQAARELLANVGKHSQATQATVKISADPNQLHLEIQDNGIGFDPARIRIPRNSAEGWGLFSIRERLAHLGAALVIESALGQGARILLTAPLLATKTPPPPLPFGRAADRKPIRILLAEDQTLTRAGLRSLLGQHEDLNVVAEASDGELAISECRRTRPDVVVMDISMPRLNGIGATRRILEEFPDTKVIALSMHADGQYVLEMLRAGASGYLLKDCAQEDLAQAIRTVDANLTFLSPGLTTQVASDFIAGRSLGAKAIKLTPREVEILKLLAAGHPAKAIAIDLKLSPKTVETHRQHIMEKLGIDSVAGLTRYAIQKGLIQLE